MVDIQLGSGIRLAFEFSACLDEELKGFRFIEQEPVVDHTTTLVRQQLLRHSFQSEPKRSGHGGLVFDRRTFGILLGEEHRLVRGNRKSAVAVAQCRLGVAGLVRANEVVAVACDPLTAKPAAKTEDVIAGRLFPKRFVRRRAGSDNSDRPEARPTKWPAS